jgi:hypothetical protein
MTVPRRRNRAEGHDKKVKEMRWYKEGRYLIALVHERPMKSGFPTLIGYPWASADGFRRSLGERAARWYKEGRYLIALAHERPMKSGFPPLIGSPRASADGFRRSLTRSHGGFASSCLV